MNTETVYRFKVSHLEYFIIEADGEEGITPFFLVRVVFKNGERACLTTPEAEYLTEREAMMAVLRDLEERLK